VSVEISWCDDDNDESDKDSLHILPLSIIPLYTKALKSARLIKNSRLEGVVELFGDKDTGSGQVAPEQLHKTFDFSGPRVNDIKLIKALSVLPSYDVYSLRIELRKMGIEVDEHRGLRLSDKKAQQLTHYMMTFTKPLIRSIYGNHRTNVLNYDDLLSLFVNPNVAEARKNLAAFAKRLDIEVKDVPEFLRDYGDVYLSLSYYQYCLDENHGRLEEFFKTVDEIQEDTHLKSNHLLINRCLEVKDRLQATVHEVQDVLEIFKLRTIEMWKGLTGAGFQSVKSLIGAYQTNMGGALCAITVKMNAWAKIFPVVDGTGLFRRAEFVMNEMRQGIDRIQPINYADLR
jgi:hypothetical protein